MSPRVGAIYSSLNGAREFPVISKIIYMNNGKGKREKKLCTP